jgi:hypothetical protein
MTYITTQGKIPFLGRSATRSPKNKRFEYNLNISVSKSRHKFIKEYLNAKQVSSCVDFGCKAGRFLKLLSYEKNF